MALKYSGEGAGFKVEGAIGYGEVRDTDGAIADEENESLMGSASVLHEASGLNITFAAGRREFEDGDIQDARFIYAKLGWLANLSSLGPTAFYGEYGRFKDFASLVTDPAVIAAFGGDTIIGSEADVWGIGVVQHIEAAEMQLYLAYRNYSTNLDVTLAGAPVATDIEDLDIIIGGAKISF